MKQYKIAKIYKGAAKSKKPSMQNEWFVYYSFNENYFNQALPVKFKRIKLYEDINSAKSLIERNDRAESLCLAINQMLREGYNPFKSSEENKHKLQPQKVLVIESLNWALSKKTLAHKSALDFKSVLKAFSESITSLGYNVEAQSFTKIMMKETIDHMVKSRDLGAHAHNKYRIILGVLFEELINWERIKENPCRFKGAARKPKPKIKVLPTEEIREKIKVQILKEKPEFFNYLMVIYMTSIRPVEILKLKVGDVDKKHGTILLRAENVKDREDRIVIIPEALNKYLDVNAPDDWYLFGYEWKPQQRNKPLMRDHATKLWQKLIIDGLGINVKMYWMKHMGLTAMRQQGIDPEVVQLHAGHSSYETTQKNYIGTDRPEVVKAIRKLKYDF